MKKILMMIFLIYPLASCEFMKKNPESHYDEKYCDAYSGLPKDWLESKFSGMVKLNSGRFNIGNNKGYPEEKSLFNPERTVKEFWIDRTEVTVAQFKSFVQQTGYVTEAELQGEAAVFSPDPNHKENLWWKIVKGANWKTPYGPNSDYKISDHEPVRLITLKDAIAYATWLGRDLPTEEQWEYAAKYNQSSDAEHVSANIWNGDFPYINTKVDGYIDVAPVGCFKKSTAGLYDMIGNVWEYTKTPFLGSHDDHMGSQAIHRSKDNDYKFYTIKGGSYLCAQNYCQRYTSTARHPQEMDLAMSHVGFRTVFNLEK